MSHRNKVIDIDKGWKRIINGFSKADNSHVDIGFLEGDLRKPVAGEDSILSQAQVAAFNEFGTPERPFMRLAFDTNKTEISSFVLKTQRAVIDGNINVKQGLKRNGAFIKSLIQKMIVDLQEPPNSPETVLRKGFNDPLIDTKQMLNGVDHKEFLSKNPKKLRAA